MGLTNDERNKLTALRASKSPKFRTFVNISNGRNAFWKIAQVGRRVTVEYGHIWDAGRIHNKDFDSNFDAVCYVDNKILEKLRKGYEELK